MAKLVGARGCGYVKSAEFIFNFNDTATDSVDGKVKTFGSNFNDALVLDCINLPVGTQFIGGDLIVEIAGVGPTAYTVALGVAGAPAQYLAATSLLATSRTALPLLLSVSNALGSNNGQNLRLTMANTVANATAGRFRISVQYKLDGQVMEATPS